MPKNYDIAFDGPFSRINRWFSARNVGIGSAIGLMLVAMIAYGGWFTINQGERGLVLRWGEVVSKAEPGFHFKVPFMDSVEKMEVRTKKVQGTQALYSKDVQGAAIAFSVNYSLNPAELENIYGNIGLDFEDRVVMPQIMDKYKNVFGTYAAVDIVQNRSELTRKVIDLLQAQLTPLGIVIESVQLENIDFSDAYEESVERRMQAEVEVQRAEQERQQEEKRAAIVRIKAEADAYAKEKEGQGQAKKIELVGEAEAKAIRARNEALNNSPWYIKYVQAIAWNGVLPTHVLPTTTVPIINTDQSGK